LTKSQLLATIDNVTSEDDEENGDVDGGMNDKELNSDSDSNGIINAADLNDDHSNGNKDVSSDTSANNMGGQLPMYSGPGIGNNPDAGLLDDSMDMDSDIDTAEHGSPINAGSESETLDSATGAGRNENVDTNNGEIPESLDTAAERNRAHVKLGKR
jgi:hypothetical protein